MADGWLTTPDAERLRAEKVNGVIVEYVDLRPGDVFRPRRPDGSLCQVFDSDVDGDPDQYCLVTGPPRYNEQNGWGFAVEVIVGTLEDLRKRLN